MRFQLEALRLRNFEDSVFASLQQFMFFLLRFLCLLQVIEGAVLAVYVYFLFLIGDVFEAVQKAVNVIIIDGHN